MGAADPVTRGQEKAHLSLCFCNMLSRHVGLMTIGMYSGRNTHTYAHRDTHAFLQTHTSNSSGYKTENYD